MNDGSETRGSDKAGQERKVALVTGASSGIGEAFAGRLADDGYALVLVSRSEDELSRVAGMITARTDLPVAIVATDLTEPGAYGVIAAALEERGASPEIVVNAAGFGLMDAADGDGIDRQLNMIDLNCRALTELSLRFLPAMRQRGRGGIINISSTAAFMPGPFMAVYYATKSYDLSFGEALAAEVSGSGVTVTTVCPGPTRSNFQATAGMAESRLVRYQPAMSPQRVAEMGYAGFKKGRAVVVPGLANKVVRWTAPLVPRAVLLPVVRFLQNARQ